MSDHISLSPAPLSEDEKRCRLRLARAERIGPVTYRHLLARYGSAEAALAALPELAAKGGRRKPYRIPSAADAEAEYEAVARIGATLIYLGEHDYPPPLAALEDAPPVLCRIGHADLPLCDALAIVGSRNASANGKRFARGMAQELGGAGLSIVSGMARGIDAAAHEGGLASGTVAVLAGGADVIYPKENTALYERIRTEGTILSEMPPGTVPQARHFPRRNRIVSGLSLGVVVVEAALRSGSLISARCAGEQGREVFAVPGSPLDPRCKGTNDLIRNGAVLTESSEDVLRELAAMRGQHISRPQTPTEPGTIPPPAEPGDADLDAARKMVIEALGPNPVPVDDLIRETGLPAALVQTVLLEFDLAGRLERHAGQRVSLLAG
jgi:DNA processing protein